MAEFARFSLDDGGFVLVEVGDRDGLAQAARVRDVVESAATSFGAALAGVRDAAATALRQFRAMDARPDEIQVEFGVRFTAQAGAVIAKAGGDGHLKVKLTWQRSGPRQEDEAPQEDKGGTPTGAGDPAP